MSYISTMKNFQYKQFYIVTNMRERLDSAKSAVLQESLEKKKK